MAAKEIKSQPLWQSAKRPKFRKATKSAAFDVVVIGGGITGLTAAYLLKKAGKKVAVVERYRLGFMDTGLTTAHLTYVTDERVSKLISNFGEDTAARIWQAGAHAIDLIESTADELQADCQFHRVPGFLHESLVTKEDETQALQNDAEAARSLGFPADFVAAVPYFNRPGVCFPDQAKFHPLRYLAALAAAVNGDGSRIFEQTEVSEVQDDPLRVVAGNVELSADYVVIATHVPLAGKTGLLNATLFQTKLYPYSSYVLGASIPKGVLPEACFWDTSDPYYYLRVEQGKTNDYVIFGGEDHKTGQETDNEARFTRLKEQLTIVLPAAVPDRKWSGQVVETNDGLPYIGETAPRQFVATGYSGNGMTFGTLAGHMACDAVLGRNNPWKELFAVDRKSVRAGAWDYVAENVDYPYYFVKDRLTAGERVEPESLAAGEGKILLLDGERVACCRDQEGKLCAVSAACTHMGCLVRWNNAEQTWDCPCHGSRFKPTGEVLAGPAETPLEPHALKQEAAAS